MHEEEDLARKDIELYLPELCKIGKFIIADELNDENNKAPDLQNDLDNIGIEVTIAEPQEEMRVKHTAFDKTNDEDFLNTVSKEAWSEPHILDGFRFLMGKYSSPDVYFSIQKEPLKNAINKKLKKLNTTRNRKSFQSNGLFLCNEMPLNSKEKIDEIYNFILEIQKDYIADNPLHNTFDFIIISAQTIPNLLCYFDIHDKNKNKIIKR